MPDANEYLVGTIATPSAIDIIAATNAYPMVVTVSVDSVTESNTYIIGQLVRLTVPRSYGMWQANGAVGQVTAVSGSNLSLDIDSRLFDAFSVPSGNVAQPASLAPAGSKNLEFNNNTANVPFKSLNNRGN